MQIQHRVLILTDHREKGKPFVNTRKNGVLVFDDAKLADRVHAAINSTALGNGRETSTTHAKRQTRLFVGRNAVDFDTSDLEHIRADLAEMCDDLDNVITAPVSIAAE